MDKAWKTAGRATELTSARLRFRRARADDLDAIHVIMSDEATMKYWSSLPHKSRDETARWLDTMLAADQVSESDEFVLEHEGEVIGKFGAWRLPEIGFFLRRDHWGRGFASEALGTFVRYMAARGVTCLTADVDPTNAASLKLLKSAGFKETGRASATYTGGSRVCDSVYFRLDL